MNGLILVLAALLFAASASGCDSTEPDAQATCGGCAIPYCDTPRGPCDCGCLDGAMLDAGPGQLVCNNGCFEPIGTTAGEGGAGGTGGAGGSGGG